MNLNVFPIDAFNLVHYFLVAGTEFGEAMHLFVKCFEQKFPEW